jgi:hypothetical protein
LPSLSRWTFRASISRPRLGLPFWRRDLRVAPPHLPPAWPPVPGRAGAARVPNLALHVLLLQCFPPENTGLSSEAVRSKRQAADFSWSLKELEASRGLALQTLGHGGSETGQDVIGEYARSTAEFWCRGRDAHTNDARRNRRSAVRPWLGRRAPKLQVEGLRGGFSQLEVAEHEVTRIGLIDL